MLIFDTIVALATPNQKSALAIIRLSGDKTKEILSHLIKKDVDSLIPNQSFLSDVYKDEKKTVLIDQCMITFYKGPKSYTGYDSADFYIHGNMIIAEEMITTMCKHGARRALKGEFSAQSYFSGKMDLLKAQGINDLINANSTKAKDIANNTMNGKNKEVITTLKNDILECVSQLEYYVEDQYTDEQEDYDKEVEEVSKKVDVEIKLLEDLLVKIKSANRQYQGIQVAIVGKPNVGKSTLLNALLKEDKAIVSSIPGTTRDVVEGEKEINGVLFKFKDTAGLRKTKNIIEIKGIEKSTKMIKESDIVLLCSDADFSSLTLSKQIKEALKDKEIIKVKTKKDLDSHSSGEDIQLCSLNDDLNPLINLIFSRLNIDKKEESAFLGLREEDYLNKIKIQLENTLLTIKDTKLVELVSDQLRKAVDMINEMVGEGNMKTMEDIYETLFSNFCLGK